MSKIKILHAADLHLDSPFEGLSAGKAAIRRAEQRDLLSRLAVLSAAESVDLVLLSGDLLDSANTYFETGDELIRALQNIDAPVFISPGNHDYYTPKSPYARLKFPENVHVFKSNAIEQVKLPALGVQVFGAAFTDSRCPALLENFRAEKLEGVLNLMCIHGEVGLRESTYNPISERELMQSGMDYVALGHIHKAGSLNKAGGTWYSWPGCPEGRGFDELGEKTVNIVELGDGECKITRHNIASRRYELIKIDISDCDALLAIHTQIPDDTIKDIYRIVLTGETEAAPDLKRLYANLSEMFFELQLRDETRMRKNIWEKAGDDTLRGQFLMRLKAGYDKAHDDADRILIEQAARWGLAALDNAEEVVCHED